MRKLLIILMLLFVGADLRGRPFVGDGHARPEEGRHWGLPLQVACAADTTWGFDSASQYTYDTSVIEVTGGVARLKDLGGTIKDDSIVEYNIRLVVWNFIDNLFNACIL